MHTNRCRITKKVKLGVSLESEKEKVKNRKRGLNKKEKGFGRRTYKI